MEQGFKILLATDYSKAVMYAERYAVQFAKATNSKLILLHVYQIPISSATKPVEYANSLDELEKAALGQLVNYRNKIFSTLSMQPGELASECIISDGNAGKEIIRKAKEAAVDLIIVGTHGASGFRKVFFGTQAWNVIKKSSIPVLAIPKDALFAGIKNIVFATGYRKGEIPALNYLLNIAKRFKALVTVLHVTNYVLSKQFEAEMFGRFKKEILEKLHYDKLEMKMIKNDNITRGIEKFCNENNVDWLAVSPKKPLVLEKLFLPNMSVTRKMSFCTHVPLLTVPDTYDEDHPAT